MFKGKAYLILCKHKLMTSILFTLLISSIAFIVGIEFEITWLLVDTTSLLIPGSVFTVTMLILYLIEEERNECVK